MALGAERGRVLRLILRQGMRTAGIGLVVGGAAAFGATRLLASLLFGVAPTDVVAFGAAAGLLTVSALVATWLPARRAAGVDPMTALRSE